eukprot:s5852_g5.t1
MHDAVLASQTALVQLLSESGADKHKRDDLGRTPIYDAACSGNWHIVTYLIQRGVDVDARDADGRSALFVACQVGCLGTVRLARKGAPS